MRGKPDPQDHHFLSGKELTSKTRREPSGLLGWTWAQEQNKTETPLLDKFFRKKELSLIITCNLHAGPLSSGTCKTVKKRKRTTHAESDWSRDNWQFPDSTLFSHTSGSLFTINFSLYKLANWVCFWEERRHVRAGASCPFWPCILIQPLFKYRIPYITLNILLPPSTFFFIFNQCWCKILVHSNFAN